MDKKLPLKYLVWMEARKKYHLSHPQIQMARELGLNPKKFGKFANHKQEPWKLPLGEYIEKLYLKHFKRRSPENVRSLEELAKFEKEKKEARKQRKQSGLGQNDPDLAKLLQTPESSHQTINLL